MTSYLTIGSSCAVFNEDANRPPDLSNLYMFTSSDVPIKVNGRTPASTGWTAETGITLTTLSLEDYRIKIWFNPSLVLSGANRQKWRYLTANTATVSTVHGSPGWQSNTANVATGSNWPALQTSIDNGSLTSAISGFSNAFISTTSVKFVTSAYTNFDSGFQNLLSVPSPDNGWYLKYTDLNSLPVSAGDTNTYLDWDSAQSKWKLTNLANTPTYNTANLPTFTFGKRRKPGTDDYETYISLSSTGTVSSGFTVSYTNSAWRVEIIGTSMVTIGSGASQRFGFSITTTRPVAGSEVAGLNTDVTMIRAIDNAGLGTKRKLYLGWDLTNSNTFTLRDYWKDGLSQDDIKTRLQFNFSDITPTVDNQPQSEYYLWSVRNSATSAISWTNSANVVVNSANTAVSVDARRPPTNQEGWVFVQGTTGKALVYVKMGATTQVPVGYMNISATTNSVSFASLATADQSWSRPLPTHVYAWDCVKCTTVDGTTGLCISDAAGAAAQSSVPPTFDQVAALTTPGSRFRLRVKSGAAGSGLYVSTSGSPARAILDSSTSLYFIVRSSVTGFTPGAGFYVYEAFVASASVGFLRHKNGFCFVEGISGITSDFGWKPNSASSNDDVTFDNQSGNSFTLALNPGSRTAGTQIGNTKSGTDTLAFTVEQA